MDSSIYILVALSQVILLIYLYRKNKNKHKDIENKSTLAEKYPYESLRTMALNITPGMLLSAIPEDITGVYAVVMDWNLGDDIVTLIANLTGDASIYVKSGGGIIGGGNYPEVVAAAQKYVAMAQSYIHIATPTATTPLPGKGIVSFCLLTNKGKLIIEEEEEKLEDNTSPLSPLNTEGQMLIALLRQCSSASKEQH